MQFPTVTCNLDRTSNTCLTMTSSDAMEYKNHLNCWVNYSQFSFIFNIYCIVAI